MIKQGFQVDTVFVFPNNDNQFGNPVGIIINTDNPLSAITKLAITQELGYSETVFIEDINNPTISIYNPQEEVNFAGHAVLGTYWYFDQILKKDVTSIKCKSSVVKCSKNELHWITTSKNVLPGWNLIKLNNPSDVESYPNDKAGKLEHTVIWAYINTDLNIIRARTFAPDWGIPEDEANGSGSMQLALDEDNEIKVVHGKGSVIYANPLSREEVMLGGKCFLK